MNDSELLFWLLENSSLEKVENHYNRGYGAGCGEISEEVYELYFYCWVNNRNRISYRSSNRIDKNFPHNSVNSHDYGEIKQAYDNLMLALSGIEVKENQS
jgi:hypothetical protein